MTRLTGILRRLLPSRSGIATTELALSMPFLLTAGLWGVELANFSVVNMRVGQLAAQLADNASRIGDQSVLKDRRIYEADIEDLLMGANIQSGKNLGLFENGRVIISSLEVDSSDNQYIHWQRCLGKKRHSSSYGTANQRLPDGMGPTGREVIALPGEAVMFVEIAYDYQPLVSSRFIGDPEIASIASFTVRADRDLTKIYQGNPPSEVYACNKYSNPFPAYNPTAPSAPLGGGPA